MSTIEITPMKTMSVKKCGADPYRAVVLKSRVFVIRMWGEASGVVTKESRTSGDPYSYLVGAFRATVPPVEADPATKTEAAPQKEYSSEICFLPGGIQETVEAAVRTSGGKAVEFGYDIFADYNTESITKYQYVAAPTVETAATERLAALSAKLASKASRQPHPAATPKPAPVPVQPKRK